MKILILVTASKDEPWKSIIAAQRRTWAAWAHPDVDQLWYRSGPENESTSDTLSLDTPQSTYYMPQRLKKALEVIWDRPWDYLFKTSASAYICKICLHNKAMTLPREKCYCGIEGAIANLPQEFKRATHASGGGAFFSRDVAQLLRKHLPDGSGPHVEDGMIGLTLWKLGIRVTPNAQRCVVTPESRLFNTYLYRCRNLGNLEDRLKDIADIERVENYKRQRHRKPETT
jgi:hypothetical protein